MLHAGHSKTSWCVPYQEEMSFILADVYHVEGDDVFCETS